MYKSKIYWVLILFSLCNILMSCEDILEEDIANENIILIAPSDNITSEDTSQHFSWEFIKPMAVYQLQIVSPTFAFINEMVEDTITPDNNLKVNLKNGKKYQWRVRAVNNSYSSPYSIPRTLIIQ